MEDDVAKKDSEMEGLWRIFEVCPCCGGREPDDIGQDKETALMVQLAGSLAHSIEVVDINTTVINGIQRDLLPLGGKALGEALTDKEIGIDNLVKIRDYAKSVVANTDSETTKSVFTAIYYAAIAAALCFYNIKTTSHSCRELSNAFSVLIEKEWMAPELAIYLTRAMDICNESKQQ